MPQEATTASSAAAFRSLPTPVGKVSARLAPLNAGLILGETARGWLHTYDHKWRTMSRLLLGRPAMRGGDNGSSELPETRTAATMAPEDIAASPSAPGTGDHPWQGIRLNVYEQHMSDPSVGQLQMLRQITNEQLTAFPSRSIGILGIAGGNGLDLIDPAVTDTIFGFDLNTEYLGACEARYRARFGDRLRLIETTIDRFMTIERVDLLIANLIIEYIGLNEFAAFVIANAASIGILSSVIQVNRSTGFVSDTEYATSFEALASIASDIEPDALQALMSDAGFRVLARHEYGLPNGKSLVRQDFGLR